MKITGIIVEYNPLHLGHRHHIQEARALTKCDFLIAVMSPHFTQRGTPACVDKFERTTKALENGVDVVIELPTLFATQSAAVFAKSAIRILKQAGVDTIVFGSESNDIEKLKRQAAKSIDTNLLKAKLKQGHSYASSLGLELAPNDILGIHYVREAQKLGIKTLTIQRTNQYHDESLEADILSASAIRKAHLDGIDTGQSLVNMDYFVEESSLYPFLRYRLLSSTSAQLQSNLMVSEGIENLLQQNAKRYDDYNDFINACVSKRYSKARIQRTCLQILLNHPKDHQQTLDYVRILGFRNESRDYLKTIEGRVSSFKDLPLTAQEYELRATSVYALVSSAPHLLEREIGKIIIV